MPSFKSVVFAVAAAFVAVAQADYYIDPASVPLSKRQSWCADEKRTCPIICQQTPPGSTLVNDCDPATLTYGCICGNGLQPNVSEYTLTLPFHVCQEWGTQCVTACGSNNLCAGACREDNPCGATNPQRVNLTSTTTSAPSTTSTGGPDQVFTGILGATQTGTPSLAAQSVEMGQMYGFALVLASVFAGLAAMF